MSDYLIVHRENENRFIITDDTNKEMGKLLYIFDDKKKFIIDSVVIHPAYGGKGLGSKLVKEVLTYAKGKNYSIESTCSFANRFL